MRLVRPIGILSGVGPGRKTCAALLNKMSSTKANDAETVVIDTSVGTKEAGEHKSSCTREELLELVRAIKFAKHEASIKAVHREITQVLSKKGGQFQFLEDVTVNDVKKVWKKAMVAASGRATQNSDLLQKLESQKCEHNGAVKLYTVGNGKVQHLAREYTAAAVAEAAAKEAATVAQEEEELKKYVHLFLDVPGDRSGSRPHQAIISFNKKDTKDQRETENKDDAMVVKIQMAAALDENDTTQHPMLMYNRDRSAKTFIHPDPEDSGYQKIQEWIKKEGAGGALGQAGGAKAYFYSRITTKRRGQQGVISIKVTELAPSQEW